MIRYLDPLGEMPRIENQQLAAFKVWRLLDVVPPLFPRDLGAQNYACVCIYLFVYTHIPPTYILVYIQTCIQVCIQLQYHCMAATGFWPLACCCGKRATGFRFYALFRKSPRFVLGSKPRSLEVLGGESPQPPTPFFRLVMQKF